MEELATIDEDKLRRLLKYSYRPETEETSRDVFSIIYAAASLYTLGYNLLRPRPNGWDGSLGETALRIAEISKTIDTMLGAIADIQAAIAQLPTVINALIEKNEAAAALRRANATARILTPYLKSANILRDNIGEVSKLANDIMIELEVFNDWYEKHDTGPMSFLVSVAPASAVAMLAINYSQLMKWQIRHPDHLSDYPFENGEILTHLDFDITKKVVQAYEKMLRNVEEEHQKFAADAKALFPWGKLSAADFTDGNTTHVYRFDGKDFQKCDFTLHFMPPQNHYEVPPKFFYDELYWAIWLPPSANSGKDGADGSTWLSTLSYSPSASYIENSACFTGLLLSANPSNPDKFKAAWARAHVISTAAYRISKLSAIGPELDKHKRVLETMRSSSVWRKNV